MSDNRDEAVRWLEEQAAKGEPATSDESFTCPNTGTSQCDDGAGCTRC